MFNRKYYKIGEVAEILGCTIEDILDAGYNRQVNIWVWANSWSEEFVTSFDDSVEPGKGRLINGPNQLTPHEIHQIRFGYHIEDGISVYVNEAGKLSNWTKVEVKDADRISVDNLIVLKEEVERLDREKQSSLITIFEALCDELDKISAMENAGKMDKHNIAICAVLDAVNKVDPNFKQSSMPGVVSDFEGFCQQLGSYSFPAGDTFKEYAKGKHQRGNKIPMCSWVKRKSSDLSYWSNVLEAMKSNAV